MFVKVQTVSYMRLEKGACKSKLPPHTTTKQQQSCRMYSILLIDQQHG
jgi:hypothetical protein